MSLFSSRLFYDAMYRIGAPWEGAARSELVGLVESGRLQPCRAIDLGCGSGANAIFLAEHGFTVVGVDFSPVAIRKAQRKVGPSSGSIRFVRADLTAPSLGEAEGEYDLLVDYGTLDDLTGDARSAMVRTIHRVSTSGSRFLLWCFYGTHDELPRISFTGPSRLTALIAPGEVERLFGLAFSIERLPEPRPGSGAGCFLMMRSAVNQEQDRVLDQRREAVAV
ncbi:MAG: class I SAM-dependent methyltransferase [Actinomycetota bacterium]|nr:class I SAM-dependent methyltransferase [Actinomycetota bacterium]